MSESQVSTEVSVDTAEAKGLSLRERVTGNTNAVIIAVVLVLLTIAGVTYYRSAKAEKEAEASLALSRIMPYVEAGDMQKALQGDPVKKVRGNDVMGLKEIVETYGSTEAGKTAALHAALASLALKNPSEAENYFDIASGSSSAYVVANAQAGTASVKEMNQDFAGAASLYEKAIAASEKSGNKDKYEYYAALCFEKAGDKENARKMYENLLAEFEFSEFAGEAKAGLTRLGIVVD
ncbi:MAG: tetratricopeptide repeat protein [Candidatus Kapaibacterium sp.]